MRGFRGNRAAQNQIAFGQGRRFQGGSNGHSGTNGSDQNGHGSQRPALPDWLKTPETRAAEEKARQEQQAAAAKADAWAQKPVAVVPTPAPAQAATAPAAKAPVGKPQLKVIQGGAAKKPKLKASVNVKPVTAVKAAKTKTTAKPAAKATTAKTKTTTKVTAKRKAA